MLEAICLEAMAPFCVSEEYQSTINLDYGFAAMLPGEMTSDPISVERLGVAISRSFPHAPLDVERSTVREVCQLGTCAYYWHWCTDDNTACVWSLAKLGNSNGGAMATNYLRVDAASSDAMDVAKDNIWFVVAGVPISLADLDSSPFLTASQ